MKYAANIMTVFRIALSLLILVFLNSRWIAFALFVAAGVTDLMDGVVARRTGTTSQLGAKLDTAADIVMFGVMIVCVIVWAGSALWELVPWLVAVAMVRVGNLVISGLRFKMFASIHTWGNKLAGLVIFAAFDVYVLTDSLVALLPAIGVAGLSALEETLILLTTKTLDINRKSLLHRTADGG